MTPTLRSAGLALLLALCLLFLPVQGRAGTCAGAPFLKVADEQLPLFVDDLSYASLAEAVDASLRALARLPRQRRVAICGEEYPVSRLRDSLLAFQKIIAARPAPAALSRTLKEEFIICQAAGRGEDRRLLLTGYFEPLFNASLTETESHRFPLYRVPADLVRRPASQDSPAQTGRLENGALLPYWTRGEIESQGLLAGQELLYLADPVDAFVLHVQGSGQVRLPDGRVRRVQFAAGNGHEYRSIGRLLADEGVLPLAKVTLPKIVRYLREHPQERERILHHNASFVFFRWGDAAATGPLGSLGEPLTAGRSVALDQSCFPPGGLAFLSSRKPRVSGEGAIVGWEPMARFVLNQDSGSAIKGPGRLDLYWGAGQYAEVAAGHMKQPGSLYFLVKKGAAPEAAEKQGKGAERPR
jgi:membrane-bound lytic murein transglycosylase A